MSDFFDAIDRLDSAARQREAVAAAAADRSAQELDAVVPEVRRLLLECAEYLNQSAALPRQIELPGHKAWFPKRSPAGYLLHSSGGARTGGRVSALLMPDGRFWSYTSMPAYAGFVDVTAESLASKKLRVGAGDICCHEGAPAVSYSPGGGDATTYYPLAEWLASCARRLLD